jgi:hypothetical protein
LEFNSALFQPFVNSGQVVLIAGDAIKAFDNDGIDLTALCHGHNLWPALAPVQGGASFALILLNA